MESKLLHLIDCTLEFPKERYFANGSTTVAESTAGRYRESEATPHARFGYRFAIENPGRPHLAVIRYPDDKRRFMCMMDGTSYDLTTGLFTGWEQPLSGDMLELRQVFWPRWRDCSIVFMTWSQGEPAAVAAIEIWELEDLPPLKIPQSSHSSPGRWMGIQYEDPCGTGAAEGALTRREWVDRVVSYARHTGQNLLIYPMAWYHGPLFPSANEPADGFTGKISPDRKQYVCWTTEPADWYGPLLQRLGKAGIDFIGALTLLRLGSLMRDMNIDLDAIKAGADTYNNMLWNNRVQSSAMDWTTIYNARNFNRIAANIPAHEKIEPFRALDIPAYGEKRDSACHTGPMFNPLHPTVQQAILRFVTEIGDAYGAYPAFKGISFNMFAAAMPWFGSIHAGYDDYTIARFQDETGIRVPVNPEAPDRFAKRYEFLTFVCRPAWIAWRCRRIRDLFRRIRAALAAAREDLRVVITLWDETVVMNTFGPMSGGMSGAHQLHARQSMLEFYKDAGINPDLYRDELGIDLDFGMGGVRDRGGHGARPDGGVERPIEEQTMYRDHDYLDAPCLTALSRQRHPGAFVFNCWVESWGKYVWFRPDEDDPNIPALSDLDGKPAEEILRANSEYPHDDFWWDSQSRITPAFPAAPHFLEPYAHALAELDACRITRGGLFLDKAHGEALQQFARAYRPLPAVRFDTVGHTTDPVAARTAVENRRRYWYAVNREYYPIDIEVDFSAVPADMHDLAADTPVACSQQFSLSLGPYELRSFTLSEEVEVERFSVHPPPDVARMLRERAHRALDAIAAVREAGKFIPGMDEMALRIPEALEQGHLAWLRRALTGYIIRKCCEVAGEDGSGRSG